MISINVGRGRGRGRGRGLGLANSVLAMAEIGKINNNVEGTPKSTLEGGQSVILSINTGRGRGRGRGRGLAKSALAVEEITKTNSNVERTPISQPGFTTQPRRIAYDTEPWLISGTSTSAYLAKSTSTTNRSRKSLNFPKERPKEDLEDFFTKMLPKNYKRYGVAGVAGEESVIITPKPPPDVAEDMSLDDIPTPKLSSEEKQLSDFEQELVIIFKKCESAGRFDIIPPSFFSSWFNPENEPSHLVIARMISGEGPHKFYLMWRQNVYIHTLMQNWLMSLVNAEKIEEIESEDLEELKGGWVAALDEDGTWYRAKVAEVYCGNSVSVIYPDRGGTYHALPLERLRNLPGNLWYHQGLCFRAALAGVSKDDAEWDSNELINTGFIQQLESLDFLDAEIVREDENGIVEVNLWENGGVRTTLNERVHRYISEWSQDIRYGLTPEDIQKVTIKENTAVLYDKVKLWQIVKVITPSYFTVRMAYVIDKWKERMQKFYDELDHGRLTIRQGRVEPLQCYAYYFPEDSSWNRVQVITADNDKKSCQIYFWDLGIYTSTEFENLRKLIPQFCSQPPEAYRCYLVDMLSDKRNPNGQPMWSQKTIDEFRKLAPERAIMSGVIVTRSEMEIKNVGMRLNLGVILLEQIDETKVNPMRSSLQHKLCELELAIANGIAAGGWNTLQKFQNYVAASPQISPVFMNESSPLLWKKTYDYYTEWVDPKAIDQRKFMPIEIRKYLCWVKIVTARSPSCLIVQIQEQIPALMYMMSRLSQHVKNQSPPDESTVVPGLFIAVYCRITGQSDDDHWYRAIVTEVLPTQNFKVVLMDFCIPYIATIENIRSLPKKFLLQPSYAHRVHVDLPLVPKLGTMYTEECCDFFRKYVKIWNFACPIYYIWKRKEGQVVELEDIFQNLQFNFYEERFEKCELQEQDIHLSHMKDNPLLSHLFLSIGIIIEYENFNPPDKAYTFSALHKILIDRQFALCSD